MHVSINNILIFMFQTWHFYAGEVSGITMDVMWLFTVPVLKLSIKIAILLAAVFLIIQIIRWAIQSKPPNPFTEDIRQPRKLYQNDQKNTGF